MSARFRAQRTHPTVRDRSPLRRGLGLVVLAAILGGAAPAAADPARDRSRAAFMQGVAEAHKGHYTAARDAFLEAYSLFPHPSILLNLGIARWHTGEYVQAEKDLTRFLSDDGGASDEEIANGRAALAAARQHLGTVRMRISPDGARAMLDGAPVALVPGNFAEVRAVMGPSRLRVEAEGYQPIEKTISVSHEEPAVVDLTLAPSAERPAPPGPAPPAENPRTVGYVLLGTAGVLAVAGTVSGIRAISLAGDYNTPGSGAYQDPDTKSTGIAYRTVADVLFVSALGCAGASAYFLFFRGKGGTDPGMSPKASTSVLLLPGAAVVSGRF